MDARVNLGLTLATLNRLREAKNHFQKVLKVQPRNALALYGMAAIAKTEGRMEEAGTFTERALKINPLMPSALASVSGMRKMTPDDAEWLERATTVVDSSVAPADQAELLFAIGKYYDDVKDYKRAFESFERANRIHKTMAEPYNREAYRRFVDETERLYTRERVAQAFAGASQSSKPVFVIGMPRSGTSLVEQIIASHPDAKGAGELGFWAQIARKYGIEPGAPAKDDATGETIPEVYLRTLLTQVGDAQRVVDKAPINSDYVGLIHSLFPNARFLYMQRDPIDTCLSCYFQKFLLSMDYTTDLSDLAHYYTQHHRLMGHWRKVLPAGTLLDVPYADLVSKQVEWTRKILDFIGLDWHDRTLDFHSTQRVVATASFWQVRQKMYTHSIARWRNYEKYVGPLLGLKKLA